MRASTAGRIKGLGGPSRNRTGVQGFAVLCVTTPPSGRKSDGSLPRLAVGSTPLPQWAEFDEGRLAQHQLAGMSLLEILVCYRYITAMTVQAPIPDFAAARTAMVDNQLRPQGVTDPAILEAMATVPREDFLPRETRMLAYVDRAVLMGDGRYMPASTVLGSLLMQMRPIEGQRALVIGGGSGYSAAVLKAIGLSVKIGRAHV